MCERLLIVWITLEVGCVVECHRRHCGIIMGEEVDTMQNESDEDDSEPESTTMETANL